MSKHRNFKLNKPQDNKLHLDDIRVGDVFEREGALCMKVSNPHDCHTNYIVNLESGSVWKPFDTSKTRYRRVECSIGYDIKGK